jgi:uracil-DNA glycosylase family 4
MSRIFISYRRQDSEGYVGRLYDHLIQYFDRNDVFIDVDNIPPGSDFVTQLEDAVAMCDVFIAVIGPLWATITDEQGQRRLDQWDDFVRLEAASALKGNKLVIPVLVGQAKMPAPHQLPDDIAPLARRNAVELSHQRFSYDVQKLVDAIRGAISSGQFLKTPADAATRRQKETALKQLRIELVGATESPLYSHRVENGHFPVLGDGSPDAALLFIGEAPGPTEVQQGRPFIGPSGAVFDDLLNSIRLQRSDVFVTNLLLDCPPQKRDPLPAEIAFYEPFVDRIIDIVQPVVLVTLGRFAMQYLLKKLDLPEKTATISKVHGKLIKARLPYGEIHVVPLYHPAMVLYNPSQKDTLRKDFEKLKLFV